MQENDDDDAESIENEEETSEDNESDDYDEEGIDLEDINKDESNFSHFKNEDVSAQVKKGMCNFLKYIFFDIKVYFCFRTLCPKSNEYVGKLTRNENTTTKMFGDLQ